MNTYAKLAAAAAAALVVAFVGYRLLPGNGGIGGQPTNPPSPTPSLLARGEFTVVGIFNTTLDATGAGSNVDGTMRVMDKNNGEAFTVDLQCERVIDGERWIAGDVTESTYHDAAKGTRTAIVLEPGVPVKAGFIFQMDDPQSASCEAFFDDMIAIGGPVHDLIPIVGTVQLAP